MLWQSFKFYWRLFVVQILLWLGKIFLHTKAQTFSVFLRFSTLTAQNIINKKKNSRYFLYMTIFLIVLDLNMHWPIGYGLKMKQMPKCLLPYLESSDQNQYSCSALLNLQTTSFQTQNGKRHQTGFMWCYDAKSNTVYSYLAHVGYIIPTVCVVPECTEAEHDHWLISIHRITHQALHMGTALCSIRTKPK